MVNKPFFSLVGYILHSPIFCKPLILKIGPGADSQNKENRMSFNDVQNKATIVNGGCKCFAF